VLILATVISLVSLGVVAVADSAPMFAAGMVLQGIYRALDSGPLEAWFVDATLADDPDAPIERGLGHGSSILSLAIAAGALLSGGLVALRPVAGIDPLLLPLLVAIGLVAVNLVAIVTLMTEAPRARDPRAVARSVRAVPAIVGEGLRLLRSSTVLRALVAVELSWGFAMVTFESLFPIRLAELVGGTDDAAAIMGPVGSGAWFAAAAGAAAIVAISGRIGVARSAALLRIVHGATVVAMGLLTGPIGVVVAYLACYAAHGASNPMHTTLLHRQVDGPHRTTVLSMNSMAAQPAGSLGTIILAAVADGTSVSTAMVLGGLILAAAAPLYVPALRAERTARAHSSDAVAA
jgi:hypothetical protein